MPCIQNDPFGEPFFMLTNQDMPVFYDEASEHISEYSSDMVRPFSPYISFNRFDSFHRWKEKMSNTDYGEFEKVTRFNSHVSAVQLSYHDVPIEYPHIGAGIVVGDIEGLTDFSLSSGDMLIDEIQDDEVSIKVVADVMNTSEWIYPVFAFAHLFEEGRKSGRYTELVKKECERLGIEFTEFDRRLVAYDNVVKAVFEDKKYFRQVDDLIVEGIPVTYVRILALNKDQELPAELTKEQLRFARVHSDNRRLMITEFYAQDDLADLLDITAIGNPKGKTVYTGYYLRSDNMTTFNKKENVIGRIDMLS